MSTPQPSQATTNLSFLEVLVLFRDIRLEIYKEQHIEESQKLLSFKHILNWIKISPKAKDIPDLQRLFQSLKLTPFVDESVKAIQTAYYDQCHRVVNCLRFFAPTDVRPWELTMMLPQALSRTFFYTSAFMMTVAQKPNIRNRSGFYTVAPTSFERILYIMALVKIVKSNASLKQRSQTCSPPVKKRRTRPTAAQLRQLIPLTRDGIQRVGYGCQTVIRSWDIFARSRGFKNCEDMVAPYILFHKDSHSFHVISERTDGFAPLEQSVSLLGTSKPCTDESNCSSDALQRSNQMDSALRSIASLFLKDLFSVACSLELQNGEEGHECQLLKSLEKGQNPLPPRFASIPLEITNSLASITTQEAQATEEEGIHNPEPGFPSILKKSSLLQRRRKKAPIEAKFLFQPSQQKTVIRQITSCSRGEDCICHPARNRLEDSIQEYVRMYNCSFEELSSLDESDCPSGGLDETAQLELSDPPFNHRRENGNPNSSHDVLTLDQMELFSTVLHQTVREGGQVLLFCSPLQFKTWYDFLNSDSLTPGLNVDTSPLAMVNRPGHFFGNIRKKTTALHPVVSWAIHATKTGVSIEDTFATVNYSNHGHVPSRHPPWTNAIDDVGRLQKGELLRGRSSQQNRSTAFRPEQKSVALLRELICRFSTPGTQVVDHFAGTFSTAVACISLPHHRTFVGCESDPEVFQAAKNRIIEVYANSLLDEFCDITTTSTELLADAKLVQEHAVSSLILEEHWSPPKGFPAFQTLPHYHSLFLSAYWRRPGFHSLYKNKPVSDWPPSMKAALHCTDTKALSGTECSHLQLYVAKSTIQHPDAGNGLFTAKYIRKGEIIGYYYGVLVYSDLLSRTEITKSYGGEGVLGATKTEFGTFALKVPISPPGLTVNDKTVSEAYIVPKEFCVCSFINDAEYRFDDDEHLQATSGMIPKRSPNVCFKSSRVSSLAALRSYTTISVRALRDIEEQEELFVSYN